MAFVIELNVHRRERALGARRAFQHTLRKKPEKPQSSCAADAVSVPFEPLPDGPAMTWPIAQGQERLSGLCMQETPRACLSNRKLKTCRSWDRSTEAMSGTAFALAQILLFPVFCKAL